ncbi:2-amino-4-hydroxy-6-hydroxymethyldihydropteridine diphosphokinase [bacterium]|nr:MAG: 2-amino-4-hydroxy-6-hydroxymethyldihydropteridine diphosphokinase [bacterium]
MKTYSVFIGLGSNLGERHRFLNAAAAELRGLPGTTVIWYSSVYETDPYGVKEQPKFLNAVGEIETSLDPPELLKELKRIEQSVGRKGRERWGPREIDLDILVYDGLVYSDESVTVPHPELERRKFVLLPLREIAPDLVHPVNGMTVEERTRQCRDEGRVVKTSYRINP